MYALSDYERIDFGTLDRSGSFVPLPTDMVTISMLAGGAFYHGTEVARFKLKEPVPNLQVEYESPLHIAFGQRYIFIGDPLDVLSDIHRHIEQVVLPRSQGSSESIPAKTVAHFSTVHRLVAKWGHNLATKSLQNAYSNSLEV